MSYGLELAGDNATWSFEPGQLGIRYQTGMKAHPLLRKLGEREVPDTAIAAVAVGSEGRQATLTVQLRPGACPILEASAGQLPDKANPYRLVLSGKKRDLAEYYAENIRDRIAMNPDAARPAERLLLAGPALPCSVKAWDGQGTFDGQTVYLRWFYTGATSVKFDAGNQSIPLADIAGVEWSLPTMGSGHVRVLRADRPATAVEPKDDPSALIFGLGWGSLPSSLPFAAAILAAIRDREPADLPASAAEPPASAAEPAQPAAGEATDVVAAIRKLGELRELGLLTDEEFQRKKAELLDRL